MFTTRIAPTLFLLVATPFLAEVPTGSAPINVFFTPLLFGLFATIGYGFPVLIIRELHVRHSLSLASVFVLGIGYGLFNEGIFARTVFHPFHAPIEQLATYGMIGNVRFPFLLVICTFHALFAVIIPILIAHWLFPASAGRPWVPAWLLWVMAIVSVAVGIFGFFHNIRASEFPDMPGEFPGSLGHFVFMIAFWAICAAVAWLLRGMKAPILAAPRAGRLALLGGFLFVAIVLIPTFLGDFAVALPLFYAWFAILLAGTAHLLARLDTTPAALRLPLVWGGEIALALFGIAISVLIQGNLLNGAVVATLLGLFATLLVRAMRARRALA